MGANCRTSFASRPKSRETKPKTLASKSDRESVAPKPIAGTATFERPTAKFDDARAKSISAVAKSGAFEEGPGKKIGESLEDYQVAMLNNYANEHFQKENDEDDKAGTSVAELLVRLFPKRAQGYNLLAAAASYREDWKECVKWLDKGLQVAPADSLVIANKAMSLEKLGDLKGAKACYKEIVRLNNDSEQVSNAKQKLLEFK